MRCEQRPSEACHSPWRLGTRAEAPPARAEASAAALPGTALAIGRRPRDRGWVRAPWRPTTSTQGMAMRTERPRLLRSGLPWGRPLPPRRRCRLQLRPALALPLVPSRCLGGAPASRARWRLPSAPPRLNGGLS